MTRTLFLIAALFFLLTSLQAQVVINEASNRNYRQILDDNGEYHDWIELYNAGATAVNLKDWSLSDSKKNFQKWQFDEYTIEANAFLVVFASGATAIPEEEDFVWRSVILDTDEFSYVVPDADLGEEWLDHDFNDSGWSTGQAGFGYGDDDDRSTVPNGTRSVYVRKYFTVKEWSKVKAVQLHVDYDDGFVAYLNGQEIARSNVPENQSWNTLASGNHEAVMGNGGMPDEFSLDMEVLNELLHDGENIFCIEGHNVSTTSSDFSLVPFLSFGFDEETELYETPPTWLYRGTSGYLHTNFKLDSDGEKVYLSNALNELVDTFDVEEMPVDYSIGRTNDGATSIAYFSDATPGTSNNTSQAYTNGIAKLPDFDRKGGFYESAVELVISSEENNAVIRYTTDGSEPEEHSQRYNSPVSIPSTRCIRARVFVEGKIPGPIKTATYFINEAFELPVLSVVTNESNLYGNEGIFSNHWDTFDVPAHAEYFDTDKNLAFKTNAGMQVDGGAGGSRSLEQHSFRIEPGNRALGDGDVDYQLLKRRPNRTNYPSFYVRNGSNQYNVLPYKDGLEVTALASNTNTYYSAYEPAVVFINGEFFGVYEIREKINDDFLEDNYGMKIDSLDFLGVSYFKGQRLEALRGSIDPFLEDYEKFESLDYTAEDFLSQVDQFLDIESYTDYIIAESWVGNNDWPYNNIKLFRCESTGFKWQWAVNDLEWALEPNGWTSATFDHIGFMLNYSNDQHKYYVGFWQKMMQNETYKAYFINRMADLMNSNYLFAKIGKLEQEMFDEIYPEMDIQFGKWTNSNVDDRLAQFTRNHETFRDQLEVRSTYVRRHLQNHFDLDNQVNLTLEIEPEGAGRIKINTIVPDEYPWNGIYFSDVPVSFEALANLGYVFSHWEEAVSDMDAYHPANVLEFTNRNVVLKAVFEKTVETDAGLVISEINYKPGTEIDDTDDWFELANLSDVPVELGGWYFTDSDSSHIYFFDDILILEPQDRIVVARNVNQFKQYHPSVSVAAKGFEFGLGRIDEQINLFNSDDSLWAAVSFSDLYPWPLSNDEKGRTLELGSISGDYRLAANWFKGCVGGSPGEAYVPCSSFRDNVTEYSNPFSEAISVYPNPAGDWVNVVLPLNSETTFCYTRVYNLAGDKVFEKQAEVLPGNVVQSLDLSGVSDKMLMVQVVSNLGQKTFKLVRH